MLARAPLAPADGLFGPAHPGPWHWISHRLPHPPHPRLPTDALSLCLLAVLATLCTLSLLLRRALLARRAAALAPQTAQAPATPTGLKTLPALALHWRAPLAWAARAVELFALLDDEQPATPEDRMRDFKLAPVPAEKRATWTLNGVAYRLPARSAPAPAPAPATAGLPPPTARPASGHGHRRSHAQSMSQTASAPVSACGRPLTVAGRQPTSPTSPNVPPHLHTFGAPRPLSAAKLIMNRHCVRRPYRPPPVPGAPRATARSPLLAAGAPDGAAT